MKTRPVQTVRFVQSTIAGVTLSLLPSVQASDSSEFDFRQGFDVGLSMQVMDGSFTLLVRVSLIGTPARNATS